MAIPGAVKDVEKLKLAYVTRDNESGAYISVENRNFEKFCRKIAEIVHNFLHLSFLKC